MMRLIVAVDSTLGMATDSGIPWTLPAEQQYFTSQIAEGLILMGFNTYDEVTEPLHDRTNYVATRRDVQLRSGFIAVRDALVFAQEHSGETIQNIGGAGLFSATLHAADELIITRVDGDFNCTKFFPPFEDEFTLAAESDAQHENGIAFTFQTWHPRRG
ncbi:MAG: dihydrofolate reductase [Nakamurella sp.]